MTVTDPRQANRDAPASYLAVGTDQDPSSGNGDGKGEGRSGAGGIVTRMVRRLRWPWLAQQFGERVWPTVVFFFVLSSAATLTNSPGYYVGDNRFEQFWNPARRIAKSLTIWDGSRGLGRVREDFWPSSTLPIAALRALGASPTLAEHLFHALSLTMAAVGMVLVVRLFRPRIGLEHLIAGLFMAFGAFSATFLVPSNLYYHYALAPYLFVVMFRGVHSDHPWRWAALFALLVFSPGNTDTPGLVYAGTPLLALIVFLVLVERSVRFTQVLAWLARAFVLTVWVNAVVLAKTYFAAGALGQRLNDTEAADVGAQTSSWAESFRGMGNWLSYFTEGGGLLKPQGATYLNNWVVVAFTFVPPCVAMFVLWQSRWRVRILYAMMMLLSLVVLVGAFPRGNSSPLGRQLLNAYTNVKTLTAFRNTYKIGGGLVMGVAALFAYGVMLAYRSARRRSPNLRFIPIALAFATIAAVAYPFWSGSLYDDTQRMRDLPGYWSQTFDYLAAMPNDGRSFVLPQSSRTRYRWGWVGDDIFDALDSRDHATVNGVSLSTPVATSALEAMTLVATDGSYRPGVLGTLARRLGITEVVVRNDLDWQDMNRPRPAAYEPLRHDPDFERVATFGNPGENTTLAGDAGVAADVERALPPVEIYTLKSPVDTLHTMTPVSPLLLAGDGFAWPGLTQAGLLAGQNPVANTANLGADVLADDLTHGSPLVISDANRRRVRVLIGYEADYSYLLGADQDLDRPAQDTFKQPGSQSVSWFPDASSVTLSGPPRSVDGTQLWNRPTNAFDGDLRTAWQIRAFDRPLERTFRIDLRQTGTVSRVKIDLPANTPKGGGLQRGILRFSDGSAVSVDLSLGYADQSFPARRTDWIEFEPTTVGEAAPTVGIAEMSFPGLDLREYVQAPDDVFRRSESDPALAAALSSAPTGYVFSRSTQMSTQPPPSGALAGAEGTDEESTIRRRFRTAGSGREYNLSGTLRVRTDTSDQMLDQLLGGDRGAYGSHRQNGALNGYGGNAVDGDPNTAWFGPARRGETLTVRFPRRLVSNVTVSSKNDAGSTRLKTVEVVVGEGAQAKTYTQDLGFRPECEGLSANPPPGCKREGTIAIDPTDTDHILIRVADIAGPDNPVTSRVRIDEVSIDGEPNAPAVDRQTVPSGCVSDRVAVGTDDGEPLPVPVRLQGTLGDLLDGKPVPIVGCSPVSLGDGWHRLDTGVGGPIDQVQLLTTDLAGTLRAHSDPGPAVEISAQSATRIQAGTTNEQRGSVLMFEQSWDPGWRATVNGRPLGPARDFDAVNGWVIDDTGPLQIELQYSPQRLFGLSLAVTAIGVAVCVFLVAHTPARRARARARARTGAGPPGDGGPGREAP